MKVYFDNAATTAIDLEVFEAMKPYMLEHFGNPSSIHSHGRQVRTAIERSRKKVAELLNTAPAEVFFTSGGTEADNTALRCTVNDKGIKHVISSKIEHHAVLHTVEQLEKDGVKVSYVNLDENGVVDYDHLESLLKKEPNSLVSLMHANNEIGNLLDLERVGDMCEEHNAVFHSDTVQSMAHYVHDMSRLKLDFAVGSAHKFHGPKGVGFLYINHKNKIHPFIHGGAQERNMRGGTENVYGIVGLAKAMEIAYAEMESHRKHIEGLKTHMIEKLKASIDGIAFNGVSDDLDKSLYTVLNVCLPPNDDNDMLLFNLDIAGISASGGSACSSGSSIGSHVLAELNRDQNRGAIRFSFSKYNTLEEVDYAVEKLAELYQPETTSA
ncbi:cysteine desulfurase family protein [Ekhidna sp. MALMAid0563]|uniref:cysteine desulfurase family protein n=1 Tax=Ekhidna sp. MALMAid0563 TaxID=3143937 RepID=UPI0032DE87D6